MGRKTSHLGNLTDVFNNLLIPSDAVMHHIADKTISILNASEKLTCTNEDDFILGTIIV